MSRNSTPEEWKDYCDAMKREKVHICKEPRKQTMALVMQFARSYRVEKKLPVTISGYILN